MSEPVKVLLIEDVDTDAELLLHELKLGGLEIEAQRIESEQELFAILPRFQPDIVLSDYSLPKLSGLMALNIVRGHLPTTPFVFVSATLGEELAVSLMRSGATDYVLKTNLPRVVPVVKRALRENEDRLARNKAEQELRQNEQRFRLLVEGLKDHALFMFDMNGKIASWNRAAERLYGYSAEQALDMNISVLYPDSEAEQAIQTLIQAVESGRSEQETWHRRADGSLFWANAVSTPLYNDNGAFLGYVQIVRDLTERREQENKIARLNRIYAVLSGINSAIVRYRERSRLLNEICQIAVNQGNFALAWVGLRHGDFLVPIAVTGCDEATVRNACLALPPESIARQALAKRTPVIHNALTMDETSGIAPLFSETLGLRSGAALPLVVEGESIGVLELYSREPNFFNQEETRLLLDLTGDIWFALEYIAKEERLDYLAYYDALTGLPNRRLCCERINQALQNSRHDQHFLSLIVLDIERFHFVNDTLGRQTGDQLLKEVAAALYDITDEPHSVSRLSADCFAVVLYPTQTEADAVHFLTEKILPALRRPFSLADHELRISLKAGIAIAPTDGHNADTLILNAEAALKKTKSAPEPYLFYQPQMQAHIAERMRMENYLREASEKNQFTLFYQPKIDLQNSQIVGLEALIRWNHPERGLVLPGEFIPLLEETGLIVQVGQWVIEQALRDAEVIRQMGMEPPRIAVNVSALQLVRTCFVNNLAQAVRQASQPVLDIELTESVLMNDMQDNIAKLRGVRDNGVNVMVDDFGTGYSSLSYIAALPIDALKIDRSFIQTMTESPNNLTIVTTIISLAHSLGFKVIAEGVETKEQARMLHLLRCDQAQGYFYGRPQPLSHIIERLGAPVARID